MSTPRPTEAELQILRVLWEHPPLTVRQVLEHLPAGTGYTTALKLMQIMTDKGLLLRDESNRTHVYRPSVAEERTLRKLTRDLLDRAFGGSAAKLMVAALSGKKTTPQELAEIRRVLDELEQVGRSNK